MDGTLDYLKRKLANTHDNVEREFLMLNAKRIRISNSQKNSGCRNDEADRVATHNAISRRYLDEGDLKNWIMCDDERLGFFKTSLTDFQTFIERTETPKRAWNVFCGCGYCQNPCEYIDGLLGDKSYKASRKACDMLSMLAEYAFMDRRDKLFGVFVELLRQARLVLRQPFAEWFALIEERGYDRDALLDARNVAEDYAKTMQVPAYRWHLGRIEDGIDIPMPERAKVKENAQCEKIASAFLVFLDAMLCDEYAKGKLMMFWRLLGDCVSADAKGTYADECRDSWKDASDEAIELFKAIENPFI